MNIAATQYNLETKALEIYVSGCYGNCNGCHNPELKDFMVGENWASSFKGIAACISTFNNMIDRIWILGGEPLDQNIKALEAFIISLRLYSNAEIWIFTRFEFKDIPSAILDLDINFIKCGPYIQELSTCDNIINNIRLATSNQYIMQKKDGEWQKIETHN